MKTVLINPRTIWQRFLIIGTTALLIISSASAVHPHTLDLLTTLERITTDSSAVNQSTSNQTATNQLTTNQLTINHQSTANQLNDATVIEGEQTGDVVVVGRAAIVRGTVAKGVIVLGGDCIVEGRVEGDVGAVGGSVIQREGSYIGGDVIALGGVYHHGAFAPGRNPHSSTVMFAGFNQELRALVRDPSSLLRPRLTAVYVVQRVLAVLFWAVVGIGAMWLAPGAISRAAERLHLTSLRVGVIGLLSAVMIVCGASLTLRFTPVWFSGIVGVMIYIIVFAAYFFGRVVVHAVTGRWLYRVLFRREAANREISTMLIGAASWCALLSLPYVWVMLTLMLFTLSLGLILTARYRTAKWHGDV